MTIKDTAVTFYVLGLVSGMIVAFASCSTAPDQGSQQRHSTSTAHAGQFR